MVTVYAEIFIPDTRLPHQSSFFCVDSDRVVVESVIDNFSVSVTGASIDHVATCDSLRAPIGVGLKLPLHRIAGLGQVEGDQIIGKWRDHVKGFVDNQRPSLVPVWNSVGHHAHDVKILDIAGIDL